MKIFVLTRTYKKHYATGKLACYFCCNESYSIGDQSHRETPCGRFYSRTGGKDLRTLELPNLSNRQNISCIPEGKYILERYDSQRFKTCLRVKQLNKDSKPTDVLTDECGNIRTDILIHPGNYINYTTADGKTHTDSMGCILPTETAEESGGGVFGTGSKRALSAMLDAVEKNERAMLVIES
jgi:hypothetical protein